MPYCDYNTHFIVKFHYFFIKLPNGHFYIAKPEIKMNISWCYTLQIYQTDTNFYGIFYIKLAIYSISKLPNAFSSYFAKFHSNQFLKTNMLQRRLIQDLFLSYCISIDEYLKKYSQQTNTIFQITISLCIAIMIRF